MSNYVKTTDFTTKDSLITGDPDKLVAGWEIDLELNAIAAAINSKANAAGANLTSATVGTAATSDNSTTIANTEFVKNVLADITIIDGGTF